ncbi:MAG: GNAT family N-acetyltransferase [Desulfomonilia bacterium]
MIQDVIPSGSSVYIASGCAEPQFLVKRLLFDNTSISDVQVYTAVPLRTYADFGGEYGARFRIRSFFVPPGMKKAFAQGDTDHIPLSTDGMENLFERGCIKINTALIQVSQPDEAGYMNLGISVESLRAVIQHSDMVVAQVNRFMPKTFGDTRIHIDQIDYIVEHDEPLVSFAFEEPDPETQQVGLNIARLIEDGSTIQVGFGRIPDAALKSIRNKRDIEIHSEIITDNMVDLADSGVIRNNDRTDGTASFTGSLCIGTDKLFHYVNNNPTVVMKPFSTICDPKIIQHHEKFVAINGALEIDLTGQACIGLNEHGGHFGMLGHSVFNRSAVFSSGGKGIIALRSTSRDYSLSRIVPDFSENRVGIITTQADIGHVVTEYGCVDLFGKSIRERALSLITIAHPRFRRWLLDEAKRLRYIFQDQVLPPEDSLYPYRYEDTVELDGKALEIRPVRITDEREVQNLFYTLSCDEKFYRFLMNMNSLHHSQAQSLVNVDYRSSMGLVVSYRNGRQETVVAVAHIAPDEDSDIEKVCEFAVIVHPLWQNKGIGTFLIRRMAQIARDLHFEGMRAYIWEDNEKMLKAFQKIGLCVCSSTDCHVCTLDMKI